MVKMAAEDLGLHVVEFNCYELLKTSESKTAAAVAAAFKTARK